MRFKYFQKRKRHRSGYEDGDYTLFVKNTAADFIYTADYAGILSRSNVLEFTKEDSNIENHPATTPEIKECLKDLKLLGVKLFFKFQKRDFKMLLHWRSELRSFFGLTKPKEEEPKEEEPEVEKSLEENV